MAEPKKESKNDKAKETTTNWWVLLAVGVSGVVLGGLVLDIVRRRRAQNRWGQVSQELESSGWTQVEAPPGMQAWASSPASRGRSLQENYSSMSPYLDVDATEG